MSVADPPPEVIQPEFARVLLVEDDVFDREYLSHVLRSKFHVLEADDSHSALSIIEQEEFDVLIVDNGLPGMSGERLLTECRDRQPVASRILLSGVLDLETVIRSVNDGHVFACLQKPVDPNTLLTTVHNAARACRLVRERSVLIEELAEANAQIYDEQQRLVELNNELRTLITIATHDLREPLRSTRFFLDKSIEVVEKQENPELVQPLERVRKAHDRMDALLIGLREWLQLRTSDFPMKPVHIGTVIEEVLDSLSRLLMERHVDLKVPPDWPTVRANAALIRSVLENLITNAVKFSPDRNPEVTLGWETVNDDWIRIEVSDNGIGIEPAYHEQIFGMFKRLESRQKFEGTGAGLAICQKIIQRHGGTISVRSTRGQGATFNITLRVADATDGHLKDES
jgi:signal transduction histidine kinase